MKARGYEWTRAPRPIQDSFLPPDSCTAFAPELRRLHAGGVQWPGTRQRALLRLLNPSHVAEKTPVAPAQDDERWSL
jgi:hypothetical protein